MNKEMIDVIRSFSHEDGKIAAWDLPLTGKYWDDGYPMSYGSCYGSNGERDFMIGLAKDALGD